jgi:hypothetical protein
MRYLSCTMLVLTFLVSMLGCDEDSQPPERKLRVYHVEQYVTLYGNTLEDIAVAFNKEVVLANFAVNGVPVDATTSDNRVYRIPGHSIISILGVETDCLPENTGYGGSVFSLTIAAVDGSGQSLEDVTVDCCILIYDGWWPVSICSSKCVPENRAADIDPQDLSGKITIAFNQQIAEAKVLYVEPEFDFSLNFIEHDKKLEVRFLNHAMLYNTKYEIGIDAAGFFAGSRGYVSYSFTTVAKRER